MGRHKDVGDSGGEGGVLPELSEDQRLREARNRIKAFSDLKGTNDHRGKLRVGLLRLDNLQLTSSNLATLAPLLADLRGVTRLSLGDNQLTSVPDLALGLAPMTGLLALSLARNQLESTPSLARAIAPLETLLGLSLSGNQLACTHALVTVLESLPHLKQLFLEDNPLGLDEFARRSNEPAKQLAAIRAVVTRSVRLQPEFKVILLGQGGVGKSSLRSRLMGRQPEHVYHETHSFDRESLPDTLTPPWPFDEPEPVLEATPEFPNEFRLGTPNAAVHVFDFGGQDYLWSSHRFFIDSKRAVFVICASRQQSLAQSRIGFWLTYIENAWTQEVENAFQRRISENDQQARFDPKTRKSSDQVRREVGEDFPRPSVIVVLTNASFDTPREQWMSPSEVEKLCTRGECRVELIKGYDNMETGEVGLSDVRRRLQDALYQPSMRKVWTTRWPEWWLTRLAIMRRELGFEAQSTSISLPRTKMTLDEYFTSICGLPSSAQGEQSRAVRNARRLAIADLRDLKSLGVVHWVGEHQDVVDRREEIGNLIFSPAAVRTPICNVLRSEEPIAGSVERSQIVRQLTGQASGSKRTGISEDDAELILRLMEVCQLVFEGGPKSDRKLYLVPDRLRSGMPLLIPNDAAWHKGETLLKAAFGFVPDMLMPRLIGKLWSSYPCRDLTRCSCIVDWELPTGTVAVRICADQPSGVFRAGVMGDNDGDVRDVQKELEIYLAEILDRKRQGVRLEIVRDGVKRPSSTNGALSGRASDGETGLFASSPNMSAPPVPQAINPLTARPAPSDSVKFGLGPKQNPNVAYAIDAYRRALVFFVRSGMAVKDWVDLYDKITRGVVPDINKAEFSSKLGNYETFARYARAMKGFEEPWWRTKLSASDLLSAMDLDGEGRPKPDDE